MSILNLIGEGIFIWVGLFFVLGIIFISESSPVATSWFVVVLSFLLSLGIVL